MRRVLLGLIFGLLAMSSLEAAPAETDEILAQLSKIRLDRKQIYNIRDITIRRDVFAITLTRGTIAFLEPVNGRVTGAVFIGTGDIVAIPPDAVEKQQLFRFTGSPLLTESFDTAFLRFTDQTYEEILREYQDRAQDDVTPDEREQNLPFDEGLGDSTLNYRILADLLATSSHPLFWAQLKNEKYGWFSASYDERLVEEISVTKTFEANTELGGVWASFNRRTEARNVQAAADEEKSPIDIVSYAIDATLGESGALQGKAAIRFVPQWDGERVVSLYVSPYATVSGVAMENGEAATFHQKEGFTDEEVRKLGSNRLIIVMPAPMPAGREMTITVAYSGEVLRRVGNDLAYAGDRGIWYPAKDTADRANFEMTFHYQDGHNLLASGTRVRDWQESGLSHSTWQSADSLIVGFEVGELSFHTNSSGAPLGVATSVATSKDPAVVFSDTDVYRPAPPPEPPVPALPPGPRRNRTRDAAPVAIAPPPAPAYGIDPGAFGEAMLREITSSVEFLQGVFGTYPFGALNASPLAVGSRNGLPSLLQLRSVSFLDSEQRDRLNIPANAFARSEQTRVATIAHQWMGHSVSWKSYRDQWLFEGLTSYAALLYLDNKYKNGRLVQELNQSRASLEQNSGPVWIGQRLGNGAAPQQFLPVIENKGAWIMHMLRMQMGDDAFFAMTREFAAQFKGKSATTWDFKRIAEKHMTADMDVSGDGKLDWFFDDWVFGAAIPTYALDFKVEPQGSGFVITGKITQSGVADDFVMPVPLFADDQLLGRVTVSADEGEFRFESAVRPRRLQLDLHSTILAIQK